MKIYQASVVSADEGMCYTWHTSRKAAEKSMREMLDEHGASEEFAEVEAIEFTMTRKGIVDFLNRHFTRDNG